MNWSRFALLSVVSLTILALAGGIGALAYRASIDDHEVAALVPVDREPGGAVTTRPVVKDGLEIKVTLNRIRLEERGTAVATVTLKNVSEEPLLLYGRRWPPSADCLASLTRLNDGVAWRITYLVPIPGLPPPTANDSRRLGPGESLEVKHTIGASPGTCFHLADKTPYSDPESRHDHLPVGRYRLTFTVDHRANPAIKAATHRQWVATVETPSIEFEITARK